MALLGACITGLRFVNRICEYVSHMGTHTVLVPFRVRREQNSHALIFFLDVL